MNYITDFAGYERSKPVQPVDEAAELMKQYMEAVKAQKVITERLEALQPSLRMVR